jgi:hypothetical protein
MTLAKAEQNTNSKSNSNRWNIAFLYNIEGYYRRPSSNIEHGSEKIVCL